MNADPIVQRRGAPAPAARRLLSVCLLGAALAATPGRAELVSGAYRTVAGSVVEEFGDHIGAEPRGTRIMPINAVVTFDLDSPEPSMTAVIADAVLEGGDPFPLTVRSSSGTRLPDGSLRFTGDYLREISPSGTQYLFGWDFSVVDGRLVWEGVTGWAGGHIWQVTYPAIELLPEPPLQLSVSRSAGGLTLEWPAVFADYVLERSGSLEADGWTTVEEPVAVVGQRRSVTLELGAGAGFFRLRRL
jgi:hypothetical protein